MKYTGTLIAVSDMERSKQFYQEVLGFKVMLVSSILKKGILMDSWNI